MTDARALALIGPECRWRRLPHRDAYDCAWCGSRISGILLHELKRSLGAR